MSVLLHTEGLAIGHGQNIVCEHIELALSEHELVALVGRNGLGKSTLLHTLGGIIPALRGHVLIQEQRIDRIPVRARARHVAMVLSQRPGVPLMRVRDLVGLGRHPWTGITGSMGPSDHSVLHSALEATEADHLAERTVATLSDGEMQKVFIARGLAQDTPVLLLDEPTAFLDPLNRAIILRMLGRIAREHKKVVLFSTHDLELALRYCDRVVIMHGGTVWTGTPTEALHSGELAEAFKGPGVRIDPNTGGVILDGLE